MKMQATLKLIKNSDGWFWELSRPDVSVNGEREHQTANQAQTDARSWAKKFRIEIKDLDISTA